MQNDRKPSIFLIGGHQRSGTTLLFELCNGHPDIRMMYEFGAFMDLNHSYPVYRKNMYRYWWSNRLKPFDRSSTDQRFLFIRNLILILKYIAGIRNYHHMSIDAVAAGFEKLCPDARIIGDKYPDYIYSIDWLVEIEELSCIVIYRDCRDVTSSALQKVRNDWKKKTWSGKFNTAEKIARRWVRAIELMQGNLDRICAIRYENLISNPQDELRLLGSYLCVDPDLFPKQIIRDTSIGKYKKGLGREELTSVYDIAGKHMADWGYAV